MSDKSSLDRFIAAQAQDYERALAELRNGRKRSHWMWYIFPQLRGLGRSWKADFYGIADLDEARRYLAHPVLGDRLAACTAALLQVETGDADRILGPVDALKLRSSMTLFCAAGGGSIYAECLQRFFAGEPDPETLRLIRGSGSPPLS
jgi:uncharacterized protein (DUF1810 family)